MSTAPNHQPAATPEQIAAMQAEINALGAAQNIPAAPAIQQVAMTQRTVTQGRLGYGQAVFH